MNGVGSIYAERTRRSVSEILKQKKSVTRVGIEEREREREQ